MTNLTQKILLTLFTVFILLGLIAFKTNANQGFFSEVITALVTINPLKVSVSAPAQVKINRSFIVKAIVENKGRERVEGVKAQIFLPQGLELIKGEEEQKIGTLSPKSKRVILWFVKGKKAGYYIISVEAQGELRGNVLTAEDSAVVKVREEKRQGWTWFPFRF